MSAAAALRLPQEPRADFAVPGRRFYDVASATWMVKVFPGDFYVTAKSDEVLVTVLGSCVSACIRDGRTGFGGMNHFMLADGDGKSWGGDARAARFGSFAMEKLINELLKAGCSRDTLEIKVFGGGNVTESSAAIGSNNAEFVLRYLEAEGFRCAAQDLGGQLARRIHYYPSTGKVVRRFVGTGAAASVAREEKDYVTQLAAKAKAKAAPGQVAPGHVELFG